MSATTASRGWGEVTQSLGESGLRAALRQALATAQGQSEALRRTRSLSGLLLGLDRQVIFVASAEERALKGVPLDRDPAQVRELHIPLATSRSLLATAARERRPVHAFGAALEEGGAAVDRVVARLLGAQGLLCIPLSSGAGISGVVAAALDAPWDERQAAEAVTLSVLTMAAADALADAARRGREEERSRAELTAQFRAMGKRVVHETGNPLAIVKNYLQVLANKAAQTGQFGEELAILNEELDRIARIVQRMGDPFVAEADSAAPLDLNALVREVVTLCTETLFVGRGIEVHQQLDPGLPLLRSEPSAVKQVVLNLMTNAAEAMPQGGRLMLLTSDNVNLDGELFVLLQVTDTGPGAGAGSAAAPVPARGEHEGRRPRGDRADGERGHRPAPGRQDPVPQQRRPRHDLRCAVAAPAGARRRRPAGSRVELQGGGTAQFLNVHEPGESPDQGSAARVLVVDDEARLRRSLALLLDAPEREIDECGTGTEAMTALSRQRYDLVLLDLRLPDISGHETSWTSSTSSGIDADVIVISGDVGSTRPSAR